MCSQKVLDSIHALPGTAHAAAMIRHGERHKLTSTTDPTAALLTEEGKRAATAMGAGLRHFSHLRLFHSPVERCRQTAQCLAEGARTAGLHVELAGPEHRLGFGYTKDMATACRMYSAMDEAFIAHWFTGQVPEEVISRPEHLADLTLNHITARLQEPSTRGRRLDLHVSHDWNLLVMRELLLGLTHEEAGWLGFLDGLAFAPKGDDELHAFYHVQSATGKLPWKNYRLRPRVRKAS